MQIGSKHDLAKPVRCHLEMRLGFLLLLDLLRLALTNDVGCDAPKAKLSIDFSRKQSARFYKNGGEGFMPDNLTPLYFDLTDFASITK
jgi:hypothetical protein